jgi:hypothetical protein
MRKYLAVPLVVTVALFALAGAAQAKGPSKASVEGPGLKGAIVFRGYGDDSGSSLGQLTEGAGFFQAAFGQTPSPMLPGRPKGSLGPKYTIVYTVPAGNGHSDVIRQDLYPYAKDGPVTYMPPGQTIFDARTPGGWFASPTGLKTQLVAAGLPTRPPAVSTVAAPPPSDESALDEAWPYAIGSAILVSLLAAAIVIARRRPRPAAQQ